MQQVHSFTVQMWQSMSSTCLSLDAVMRVIPMVKRLALMSLIDGVDTPNSSNQSVQFSVTEDLNSTKFDVVGDGEQERNLVDVHDVSGKKDITTLCHGVGRDIDRSDAHSVG